MFESSPPGPVPRPQLSPEARREFRRRRRGRNLALLAVLVAIAALFYAIAMVKMAHHGLFPLGSVHIRS